MEYPKPIMGRRELMALGFSDWYLRRVMHSKYANKFVRRTGTAKNSKAMFDTKEFEKLRLKGVFDGR